MVRAPILLVVADRHGDPGSSLTSWLSTTKSRSSCRPSIGSTESPYLTTQQPSADS